MNKEFDEEFTDGLSREEWLERSDKVRAWAWRDAQETVAAMGLEARLDLPREISGLYIRANAQYTRTYDNLQMEFGDRLPTLFAYTQWLKWAACWDGACWFKHSIEHGVVLDNAHTRSLCTASGYARNEGWSYTTYNLLAGIDHQPYFQAISVQHGLEGQPSDIQVLSAMALHWWWLASNSNPSRDELLEYLHEAGEADSLSDGLRMWAEAEKYALEQVESDPNSEAAQSARRLLAKTAADARHAQNQAARAQVVARYKSEKSQYSSKDAAAIAFTKYFAFEFSTIRGWLKGA